MTKRIRIGFVSDVISHTEFHSTSSIMRSKRELQQLQSKSFVGGRIDQDPQITPWKLEVYSNDDSDGFADSDGDDSESESEFECDEDGDEESDEELDCSDPDDCNALIHMGQLKSMLLSTKLACRNCGSLDRKVHISRCGIATSVSWECTSCRVSDEMQPKKSSQGGKGILAYAINSLVAISQCSQGR